MQSVTDSPTTRKPTAFHDPLHGLSGVLTKPGDHVLFLEHESGAVVTVTQADAPTWSCWAKWPTACSSTLTIWPVVATRLSPPPAPTRRGGIMTVRDINQSAGTGKPVIAVYLLDSHEYQGRIMHARTHQGIAPGPAHRDTLLGHSEIGRVSMASKVGGAS